MKKITTNNSETIPNPAILRLCSLYKILERLDVEADRNISSTELGNMLGIEAHNIRKDINTLGNAVSTTAGYNIHNLRDLIARRLGFVDVIRVCVVGLGRLGSAILQHPSAGEYKLIAAFDSNINRLETLKTAVELFPAYQISEVIRRLDIKLGIIAVPSTAAQEVADRLLEGGIQGIVNFAPIILKIKRDDVYVRNIDIGGEIRILSALFNVRASM